ncbi:MAG: hypothetical protein N3A59_02760 [Thermodesulfovibrionales bacterium]|nr:hypothetical protein [Thermodesulfovibrionales bacterium]
MFIPILRKAIILSGVAMRLTLGIGSSILILTALKHLLSQKDTLNRP